MRVSVIIPVYNALTFAQACVRSIFEAGSGVPFEVIVVDNGSAPDVEEWLVQEERVRAGLRHLRDPHPLGFARAVNLGVASATGEVLIILNSDTVVTPGWIEGLTGALQADPSLGAVTPCTNHAGEPAQMDYNTIDLALAPALRYASGKSRVADILLLPQRLTFFCVALRKAVWRELGGFDEAYRTGNFEDDDLCLRLRVAGYRLGVARHVFVYHHRSVTFHQNGILHAEWMTQNEKVFAQRARQFAEAFPSPTPHWPKKAALDVSVVILPGEGGSLDRTLRSLANQTVHGFEILRPKSWKGPTRSWIAYLREGDIFYPFHLEALLEALGRAGSDAIFADAWAGDRNVRCEHPDSAKAERTAPQMLAGWMHHESLDRDCLWDQSAPLHWPRLTWEMTQSSPSVPRRPERRKLVESARQLYRRSVKLETRLAVDAGLRKLIRRPVVEEEEGRLRELAAHLKELRAKGAEAGEFGETSTLPAVFLFNAVPWHSVVQRQHHFARGLARRGHPVFWVDTEMGRPRKWWTGRPLLQIGPGLHQLRLPALGREIYYLRWNPAAVDAMAEALLLTASAYGLREIVSVINYPRWQPLVTKMRELAHWKVLYDCLDDQSALAELYQTQFGNYEEWLVEHADLLVTSSAVLQERFRRRHPLLLHNAADYELFSSAIPAGHLQRLRRPIIGFFGALADWLDCDLVQAAATEFPDFSFVFIGPPVFTRAEKEARWLRSTSLPNITLVPQLDSPTLAEYTAEFDVCIMPFLDIPVTRTMNAVKLYEYLAAGKPIVSRDLPEVRHLIESKPEAAVLISLYTTRDEFFSRLRQVLTTDTPALVERRRRFAQGNDWSHRIDVLSAKIVELAQDNSSSSA